MQGKGGKREKKVHTRGKIGTGGETVSGTGYNGRIAHDYNEILQCNSHKALETTKASGRTGGGGWLGVWVVAR